MSEQRERMERALRECAEQGVSETTDLWPKVRGQVDVGVRRARRFVPRTRLGWVVAAMAILLFSTGAYAGSKWVYEVFQEELPGGDAAALGEQLHLSQTMDGARVIVEWAYADTKNVVIGYSVEDLDDNRKDYENDARLEPFLGGGSPGDLPTDLGDLADGSSGDFRMIDGTGYIDDEGTWGGSLPNTAVFAVPKNFEPSEKHSFRFELPLQEVPVFPPGENSVKDEPEPLIGPFVFDFEIPVHPVEVVEMDQEVEANGITLTLERVVQSPGRPQAIFCFEPPDRNHLWMPVMETGAMPLNLEEGYLETRPVNGERSGCWSVALSENANSYSFEVSALEGLPTDDPGRPVGDGPYMVMPKELPGPWKFDFTVPEL